MINLEYMDKKNRNIEKELLNARQSIEENLDAIKILTHDLKNPVSALKGAALLIYNDPEDSDSCKELSRLIIDAADEVMETLKQFLNMTEVDDINYELNLRDVNITKLVAKVIEGNKIQAAAKNQKINFLHENNTIIIKADEQKIVAAVDNLINNAVKYSPHDTTIKIRVFTAGNKVRIEIKDEGPGFSEEDLLNAFGKFKRLSAKPTGGELSSGLGLFIVKKIINLHRGDVRIESKPNEGALFIIELPIY